MQRKQGKIKLYLMFIISKWLNLVCLLKTQRLQKGGKQEKSAKPLPPKEVPSQGQRRLREAGRRRKPGPQEHGSPSHDTRAALAAAPLVRATHGHGRSGNGHLPSALQPLSPVSCA